MRSWPFNFWTTTSELTQSVGSSRLKDACFDRLVEQLFELRL